MHEDRILSPTSYTVVCAVLVALTLVTLSVSFIPLRGVWHVVAGLTIGLIKATLVVLFFMHALVGNRVTWIVIAVSCFWLGLLVILPMSDYLTRNMVPYMPEH